MLYAGCLLRRAFAAFLLILSAATSRANADSKPSELTIVPVLGGDSDVGFGGGYLLSYARTPRGYEPYLWRLESGGVITFKPADAGEPGGLSVPYVDDYLLFEFPHLLRDRLELRLRLSYTRESILKFYGLGNASRPLPGLDSGDSYYEHQRVHPTLLWLSTFHVSERFDLLWGLAYTHNWLTVPEGTLLARTMAEGDGVARRLLGNVTNHGAFAVSAGAAFDTRDDEVATERGQYYEARLDLAPGGVRALPHAWGRLTASAQAHAPLLPKRLSFAARVVSDLLFGDAPFYELPRYSDTFFGGGKGIRGVPAQRYWGKAKVFSNLELRANLVPFKFWSKTNWLGVTGFFDCGRLWTEYARRPELDGSGLGLKFGAGGGLRVTAGTSFVIRADVAYSPDASPIGAYLTSGHMF